MEDTYRNEETERARRLWRVAQTPTASRFERREAARALLATMGEAVPCPTGDEESRHLVTAVCRGILSAAA